MSDVERRTYSLSFIAPKPLGRICESLVNSDPDRTVEMTVKVIPGRRTIPLVEEQSGTLVRGVLVDLSGPKEEVNALVTVAREMYMDAAKNPLKRGR